MRAPPPFEMDCRETAPWRATQAALWALAGACAGAWSVAALADGPGPVSQALQAPAPVLAMVLTVTALAAGLGWRLAAPLAVRLAWTGREWRLGAPGQALGEAPVQVPGHSPAGPARVRLMIDLGGWLLVRLQPPGARTRWLGVSRAAAGVHWHLLRAALYCPPFELQAPRDQGGAPS